MTQSTYDTPSQNEVQDFTVWLLLCATNNVRTSLKILTGFWDTANSALINLAFAVVKPDYWNFNALKKMLGNNWMEIFLKSFQQSKSTWLIPITTRQSEEAIFQFHNKPNTFLLPALEKWEKAFRFSISPFFFAWRKLFSMKERKTLSLSSEEHRPVVTIRTSNSPETFKQKCRSTKQSWHITSNFWNHGCQLPAAFTLLLVWHYFYGTCSQNYRSNANEKSFRNQMQTECFDFALKNGAWPKITCGIDNEQNFNAA